MRQVAEPQKPCGGTSRRFLSKFRSWFPRTCYLCFHRASKNLPALQAKKYYSAQYIALQVAVLWKIQTLPYKKQKCLTSTKKTFVHMHLRGVVQQVCLNQKMSSYLLVIVPSGFPNMAHSAIPTNSPVSTTPRIWKVGKVRKTGNRPTRHRAWPPFHCLWRNSKVLPLAPLRDIKKRYACVGRRTQITPNPTVKVEICKFS